MFILVYYSHIEMLNTVVNCVYHAMLLTESLLSRWILVLNFFLST